MSGLVAIMSGHLVLVNRPIKQLLEDRNKADLFYFDNLNQEVTLGSGVFIIFFVSPPSKKVCKNSSK